MFFSCKKRTKRILIISKGRAPGVVLSPVLFAAPGTPSPATTRKTQKTKYLFQIFFPCNNSDTTGV